MKPDYDKLKCCSTDRSFRIGQEDIKLRYFLLAVRKCYCFRNCNGRTGYFKLLKILPAVITNVTGGEKMFDIVITDGILVDPEHLERFISNIGIRDGKIAAVTREKIQGITEINAAGRIVCPGFIDIHGHVDLNDYCAELSLRQGITTTVGGNCGLSPIDLDAFFTTQDQ